MPYARSIRSDTGLPGVRPDPGLLFDRKLKGDDLLLKAASDI